MQLIVLLLCLFSSPLFALDVLSQWVKVTRPHHPFEIMPQERTKPVVVGDILYFANLDGNVYAIHRTEGYVLWQRKLPAGISGALSYGRSKIFVGDIQGNLFALQARDGSVAWTFKIQSEWLSAPMLSKDRLLVSSSNDELYALSESAGKELWHFSHRGDEKMTVRGTPSPVVFGSEVYQGFSDGNFAALTLKDGKVLWTKRLRSKDRFYDIDMNAYVDEQHILVSTFDGNFFSLERLTGNTHWVVRVGTYGGILVEGDRVYFAGLNGNFYALDKSAGQILWKTAFDKGIGLPPSRAGDYLVFSTSADPVYVLDPADGKVVWTGSLGAGTLAPVAAHGDGWFYCMSNYGNLYSFEVKKNLVPMKGLETIPLPSAIYRQLGESKQHKEPS